MDWKIHRAILIAAIWIAEVLSAGICGFIAALALIPASYAARGYFAFGGEWLIVLGVTLLAFHVINNAFFKMLKNHRKEVNHMAEQNLFCLCGRCSRKLRSAAARRVGMGSTCCRKETGKTITQLLKELDEQEAAAAAEQQEPDTQA